MSLESKFAELKIGDVSSVVDAVKKDGVQKSGLAAGIEVLKARCDSKDDAECVAALKTLKALADECPEAQAFTKECLGVCKCHKAIYVCTDCRICYLAVVSQRESSKSTY